MISGLFGQGSVTNTLRGGLAEASATHKVIADRVANALQQSANTDFAGQLNAKLASEEDIERDMTSLADTQLRYDATAKLLQTSYAEYRSAIRNG
jgi:hypothetical protein